jgi:hypothetical protein
VVEPKTVQVVLNVKVSVGDCRGGRGPMRIFGCRRVWREADGGQLTGLEGRQSRTRARQSQRWGNTGTKREAEARGRRRVTSHAIALT